MQIKGWMPRFKHPCEANWALTKHDCRMRTTTSVVVLNTKKQMSYLALQQGQQAMQDPFSGGSPSIGEELALCLCRYQTGAHSRLSEVCSE